jgi:hypothetical protein
LKVKPPDRRCITLIALICLFQAYVDFNILNGEHGNSY